MKMMRVTALGAVILAATACEIRKDAGPTNKIATEDRLVSAVQDAEPTHRELAVFAPLPARMDAPGGAPSEARIALGRTLFYEKLLSDGHDVSCNS